MLQDVPSPLSPPIPLVPPVPVAPPVASIGRIVICRNHGYGRDDAPAIINFVHGADATLGTSFVSVCVMPFGGTPVAKMSVNLFRDEDAAATYLAQFPGHTPCVLFWPSPPKTSAPAPAPASTFTSA